MTLQSTDSYFKWRTVAMKNDPNYPVSINAYFPDYIVCKVDNPEMLRLSSTVTAPARFDFFQVRAKLSFMYFL